MHRTGRVVSTPRAVADKWRSVAMASDSGGTDAMAGRRLSAMRRIATSHRQSVTGHAPGRVSGAPTGSPSGGPVSGAGPAGKRGDQRDIQALAPWTHTCAEVRSSAATKRYAATVTGRPKRAVSPRSRVTGTKITRDTARRTSRFALLRHAVRPSIDGVAQ